METAIRSLDRGNSAAAAGRSPLGGDRAQNSPEGRFGVFFERMRFVAAVLLLSTLTTPSAAVDEGPQSVDFAFEPYGTIRWERGEHPVLLVFPGRGDGWITIAQQYTCLLYTSDAADDN